MLTGYPLKMRYGRVYLVTYVVGNFLANDNTVVECNLLSSPFVTHSYAMGQRQLKLKTEVMGALVSRTLFVTAPPDGNVAPAQYYMMFVVLDGIPGHGKWVQILAA